MLCTTAQVWKAILETACGELKKAAGAPGLVIDALMNQ